MVATMVATMLGSGLMGIQAKMTTVKVQLSDTEVSLSNGIVSRKIQLKPCIGTTSLLRVDRQEEFVRTIEPEAKLLINGKEYWLGGVTGVPNRAFLTEDWILAAKPDFRSIPLVSVTKTTCESSVPHRAKDGKPWKPKGQAIVLRFANTLFEADVRYEVYDGIATLGKKVTIRNTSGSPLKVSSLTSERLGFVEGESAVEAVKHWRLPNVTVLTDMTFGGNFDTSVFWEPDEYFATQVNYELKTPCVLEVHPPSGPNVDLAPGESLDSVKSYLTLHGSTERESKSLERRQFFRTLTPWVLDNPLMLHIVSNDDNEIRRAIDQASECGFEMAIMSFGSGLNMEDVSPKNIERFRELRKYANERGIRFGGYSLLASRRIDDENDVNNPVTGKTGGAIFGNSPCLGSKWGIAYFQKIQKFIEETGFQILEHDGNYPGDKCSSTTHPGHKGLEDSQWQQHQQIANFYGWCRSKGVFLNVPDNYYLNGSNKSAMGYRETNWSLPREQQHVHARQNIFDGTWDKTPSMGWMFVPLVEYHGGGKAATIEPLKDHLRDYELHFANTFANGAQACWRGTRLYDSPETKAAVLRMVGWFKKYRDILESDVVHLRRPDGRRLDFVLHVNQESNPPVFLTAFNPTNKALEEEIVIPLTGSGLKGDIRYIVGNGSVKRGTVTDNAFRLKVKVPANGWDYFAISQTAVKTK